MSETVLHIDNVSKLYRLGQVGTGTLSHDLNRWWAKVRGKEDPFLKVGEVNRQDVHSDSEYVWALRDINLEVKQGEVLGIIGKNGAGKSTLLKILARVTGPTTGQIKIKGRIGSLLEVGTGFHPELTGRENIFLNGAILGMTRAEVRAKFDAIVDFAGIERYIDTPVKRYSSGMYVRLAFAVAAFLEPEILIVDEVLAVGDAEFQKKAIGKMEDVSKGDGRTILFVSHNMAAVRQLCPKTIVLSNGQKAFEGPTQTGIPFYLQTGKLNDSIKHIGPVETAPGNENIRLLEVKVSPLIGDVLSISSGQKFFVRFFNYKEAINLDATFELVSQDEQVVFHTGSLVTTENDARKGIYEVSGQLPPSLLNAGIYRLKLIFGHNQRYVLFSMDEALRFEILNEAIGYNAHRLPGVIRPDLQFEINFVGQ